MTLVLRYAARSDRGLVRSNNEDSVYAGARLLALADGMGGHAAGEVASQLVIAALAHLDDDEPGGDLLSKLEVAVRDGNTAIASHVESDPELEGMGTTLTAILFAGNSLGLVHIGDSRGYLLREGELAQITKDDTFVQTLVDEGRITAEEAHSHPQRSLIMRALTGHEVEPTLIVREARAGDRYMLCSDGLSDPVSTDTILEAMQGGDVSECADRLIELALRGGGPDNVTVVVADVVDYEYGQTQPILAGAVSGDDDHDAPPNTSAGRASAINARRTATAKRVVAEPEPPAKKPRSLRRAVIAAVVVVLLAVIALIVGHLIINSNYYVAAYNDRVVIMRGIQGSFLGYHLQKPDKIACLNDKNELSTFDAADQPTCHLFLLSDLKDPDRNLVATGFKGGSMDEAVNQIKTLAANAKPVCGPTPAVTPPPAPTVPRESPTKPSVGSGSPDPGSGSQPPGGEQRDSPPGRAPEPGQTNERLPQQVPQQPQTPQPPACRQAA